MTMKHGIGKDLPGRHFEPAARRHVDPARAVRSTIRAVTSLGAVVLALLLAPLRAQEPGRDRLPNIVIAYADDLGYGDLSCYKERAAYTTPRLDRLAAAGIRFTDAHSPCTICSPSRYGLLSGNLVCRTGRRPSAFEGPGGPS